MTDLQIANMLADYHKECELAETLREKADVQLKHARLIREALRQPLVSGQGEQLYCTCSRGKGLDHDEDGMPYCIECEKPVQTKQPAVVRSFSMQTVLKFGKHKGKTIQQLFDEDEESYVMWMFENIEGEWSPEIERELEWRQAESEDLKREFIWRQG